MQFLHSTKVLEVAMTERRQKKKELLLIVRVLQMGSGLNSLFTLSQVAFSMALVSKWRMCHMIVCTYAILFLTNISFSVTNNVLIVHC